MDSRRLRGTLTTLLPAAVAFAACSCGGGGGSWLGPDLDKKVAAVDARFRAGDVPGGCALLSPLVGELDGWAMGMRGNLAVQAHRLVEEMSELAVLCSAPPPQSSVAGRWKDVHARLVGSTRHSKGWGTVLWWGLGLGALAAVWILLRRMRS